MSYFVSNAGPRVTAGVNQKRYGVIGQDWGGVDVYGEIDPVDPMLNYKQAGAEWNLEKDKNKFDIFSGLLAGLRKGGGGNGYGTLNMQSGGNIPAPRYIAPSPVYSQQQINAQSGLQRANLLQQATNNSRQFSQDLSSRGFSPLSPFAMLNSQSNLMRVNAGAARNETQLNFDAAQANADARMKAEQINSQYYGDYVRSLAQQKQIEAQQQQSQQANQLEMLKLYLSGLM